MSTAIWDSLTSEEKVYVQELRDKHVATKLFTLKDGTIVFSGEPWSSDERDRIIVRPGVFMLDKKMGDRCP